VNKRRYIYIPSYFYFYVILLVCTLVYYVLCGVRRGGKFYRPTTDAAVAACVPGELAHPLLTTTLIHNNGVFVVFALQIMPRSSGLEGSGREVQRQELSTAAAGIGRFREGQRL
jgi:hypothetical protein